MSEPARTETKRTKKCYTFDDDKSTLQSAVQKALSSGTSCMLEKTGVILFDKLVRPSKLFHPLKFEDWELHSIIDKADESFLANLRNGGMPEVQISMLNSRALVINRRLELFRALVSVAKVSIEIDEYADIYVQVNM
mgnify:CR=1 FL=1